MCKLFVLSKFPKSKVISKIYEKSDTDHWNLFLSTNLIDLNSRYFVNSTACALKH